MAVEVNKVWAGSTLVPSRAWFDGYVFVRACKHFPGTVLIKATDGHMRGVEVRYPVRDVREVSR